MLSLMWKVDLDLDWSWDKLRLAWQGKVGCEKHTKEHSSGFQSCQPSGYRWLKTIRYGIWLQRNKDIDIVTFKDKIDLNMGEDSSWLKELVCSERYDYEDTNGCLGTTMWHSKYKRDSNMGGCAEKAWKYLMLDGQCNIWHFNDSTWLINSSLRAHKNL